MPSSSYTQRTAKAIAADLAGFGGILRCTVCGREEELLGIGMYLQHGWPRCHSLTMRWVTQRQLDEAAHVH